MSNEINIEELERLAKELIGSVPGTASYRDLSIVFTVTMSPDGVLSLIDRLKKAESELERERMRLAACGVVALADTPESAAQAREMRDEYRSASCDDVARRVDECMTLRAERDALAALVSDLDESSSYWSEYEVPLGIVERIKEAAKTWKGRKQ